MWNAVCQKYQDGLPNPVAVRKPGCSPGIKWLFKVRWRTRSWSKYMYITPERERERAIIPVAVITRTLTHHALFTHSLGNSVCDQIIKFQRSTFFQRFQPHLTVFYNNWMGMPWLWIPHSLDYTALHLLIGSARWDCIWCVIFLYKHI